ncbi:MAG: hypothetical protein AB7O56_08970 [Bauldia sp.]
MRTRIRSIAFAAVFVAAAPAMAALPPIYQRTAELAAIVTAVSGSPDLETLGEVNAIEYVGVDLYEIRGATCTITAHIVTTPDKGPAAGPPIVGPRQFTVQLDPVACK